MMMLQLFLLALTALILTFTLGYVSLRAVTNLTIKECLAFAGGWGIALQGAIAFIGFLLNLSERNFFFINDFRFIDNIYSIICSEKLYEEPSY